MPCIALVCGELLFGLCVFVCVCVCACVCFAFHLVSRLVLMFCVRVVCVSVVHAVVLVSCGCVFLSDGCFF